MSESAKKILWVLSSFAVGAPQRRFAALISRLGADHQHVICALDGRYAAEELIEPAAQWSRLERPRRKGRFVSLGELWSIRKALATEQPDLLVTAGLDALEWLAVNRGPGAAPQLHFEDPVGPEEALEGADGKGDWARRRAFPGRNRAFVAEGRDFEILLTGRWGAPPQSVKRMPWGVDLDLVKPVDRAGRTRIAIGALSPLVAEKRHDRLLRILATLLERERDVELRLVGRGPERGRLETLAESLGVKDRVVFIERDGLDPKVAAEETAKMDVFAEVSGVSRSPAAPVLGLAAGLPFLATDAGVAGEICAEANDAFVRPVEDESALAAAAELLVSDAGLRRRIGAANRAAAMAAHSLDSMVSAYRALFEETIGVPTRLMLPAPEASAEAARPAGLAGFAERIASAVMGDSRRKPSAEEKTPPQAAEEKTEPQDDMESAPEAEAVKKAATQALTAAKPVQDKPTASAAKVKPTPIEKVVGAAPKQGAEAPAKTPCEAKSDAGARPGA